jgi:hypothetical protein
MSEKLNTKHAPNIYNNNHSTDTMRSHTHSIAIKQRTYVQLLALSPNLQDSFDKIIGRLLAEHNGHKNEKENTVSESGSGLRPLDQIPTTEGAGYNSLER